MAQEQQITEHTGREYPLANGACKYGVQEHKTQQPRIPALLVKREQIRIVLTIQIFR